MTLMPNDRIDEALQKAVDERIFRRTRPKNVIPSTKSHDLTPHREANTSPNKTSRGKAAVRRRGKKNKIHRDRFKIEDIAKIMGDDYTVIVEMVENLEDPISEHARIKDIGLDENKSNRLGEIIKNVWSSRYIEKYIGICKPGDDFLMADSVKALNEMKEWGIRLCWIEEINKSGFVIYRVCGDQIPSDTYNERRNMDDRRLILI